jgi:hypothetical protein
MSLPAITVEIGFNLTLSPEAPFFVLDDAVKGRLDNIDYRLGGTFFYDVTDRVRNVNISRGKSQIFANYVAGELNVELNNRDRAFDPLYDASPFVGNIIPRREIRVKVAEEIVFTGWVEDWDLGYSPDGDSIAVAKAVDATSIFANQTFNAWSPSEELSGARIAAALDRPEVGWSAELRDLEAGRELMGAYPVEDEYNVLNYMQNIAESETGGFFISRDGKVAFRDRLSTPADDSVISFGNGGIQFENIQVIYGAELLFNEVTVSRYTGGTAIATNTNSVNNYGYRSLTITDSQVANDSQVLDISLDYVTRYSEPEYRVERIDLPLHKLTSAQHEQISALELGDVAFISFTPNNIGDPIERYLEVIKIDHSVTPFSHIVELGFRQLLYPPFVLDSPVFGRLGIGSLAR